ncbi:MAG: PaaI family thioesterase, partial [Lentisphaeria bacterium]|nr:PaaI family thioesterase [Lentisphaeria bacterium]
DVFAAWIGAEIVEIAPGYAKAVMDLKDSHLNAAGVVQGGAIFTLADFAFAGAGNSFGPRATAMNISITYMRPGTGTKLVAEAKEVSHGRRTCLFDVLVTDDQGRKVAKLMINGFLFEGESVI